MLEMISWKEYVGLVLLVLAGHYLYVLVRYFPRELRRAVLLRRKRTGQDEYESAQDEPEQGLGLGFGEHGTEPEVETVKAGKREEEQPLLLIARNLSGEIKKLVEDAAGQKMVREEWMMAFQILLGRDQYGVLANGPFKEMINELIQSEVENKCSIHFDASELNGLWIR